MIVIKIIRYIVHWNKNFVLIRFHKKTSTSNKKISNKMVSINIFGTKLHWIHGEPIQLLISFNLKYSLLKFIRADQQNIAIFYLEFCIFGVKQTHPSDMFRGTWLNILEWTKYWLHFTTYNFNGSTVATAIITIKAIATTSWTGIEKAKYLQCLLLSWVLSLTCI